MSSWSNFSREIIRIKPCSPYAGRTSGMDGTGEIAGETAGETAGEIAGEIAGGIGAGARNAAIGVAF